MKIKKALWTSLALAPATIIPLSTATSCSQAWGFKTPLSIGSSLASSDLNPFKAYSDSTLKDLNGDPILDHLESNFAVDTRTNNMYGYCLPQKWNAEKPGEEDQYVEWEKGGFETGNAGWYDFSSSDLVKSATRHGTTKDSKKTRINEILYSYINNTLSSTTQLVGMIGSTISTMLNYALQYQGTQIGTEYGKATETDTNLATAWGGNITHGNKDSDQNKKYFESIFAANAVSGSGKAKAALHPTHIEFNFKGDIFPIPAYDVDNNKKVQGVHESTLKLLNGEASRPSAINSNRYWATKSDDQTEKVYDYKTDKEYTNKYRVYTYTNVPVIVDFKSLTRSYVDPTKTDSFIVSDYYAETKEINNAVGDTWKETLPKFASDVTKPTYCAFTYKHDGSTKSVELKSTEKVDKRISDKLTQTSFIVLLNYAYKEYFETNDPSITDPKQLDRVTMTGLNNIYPAYFLDKTVELGEDTFFEVANSKDSSSGYVVNTSKLNKYNNLLLELLKRSAGQGLITEANKLNSTSKQLLKLLNFMFGDIVDNKLVVDTDKIITTYDLK